MPSDPPKGSGSDRSRDLIRRQVARLLRRARFTSFGHDFLRAGFYALCAAAVAALLVRGEGAWTLAGGGVLAALLAAAILEPIRRRDPVALAKRMDDQGGLADRLSTAVEIYPRTTGVAEAVIEDAAAHAAGLRPSVVLPFRAPRETFLLPLPIILLSLAPTLIFPRPPGPTEAFRTAVESRREALEEFLEAERSGTESPEKEAALDRLRRLADEMGKKPQTKRSLLGATGRVIAKMKAQKKALIQKRSEGIESLLDRMRKVPLLKPVVDEVEAVRFTAAGDLLEGILKQVEEKTIPETDLGDVKKEELEALLRRLRKLGKDIRFINKALQFLEEIEGEIGELDDLIDPEDLEFWQDPKRRPPRPPQPERQVGQRRRGPPQNDWGTGTTETPFGDPRRTPPEGTEEEAVRAKEGTGRSSTSTMKAPQESGRSALSYREKYAKYKQMAEDVLYREEIPVGYREYIKRYFDRIQPEEEE